MENSNIKILQKLLAIMEDVGSLEKDKKNQMQNYEYLSESAVKHAIQPLLVKYKVVFTIEARGQKRENIGQTKTGSTMFNTDVELLYVFYDAESGESLSGVFVGTGSDTGDKGVYKAITGAIKYILTSTFLIPTGEDPEDEKEAKKPSPLRMSSYDKAKAEAKGERDVAIAKTEAGHGDITKSGAEVGADGTLFASENQLKRMYAIAFDVGAIIKDDPVKTYGNFQETIRNHYGLMSSKTIPIDKYEQIIADLEKKRVK